MSVVNPSLFLSVGSALVCIVTSGMSCQEPCYLNKYHSIFRSAVFLLAASHALTPRSCRCRCSCSYRPCVSSSALRVPCFPAKMHKWSGPCKPARYSYHITATQTHTQEDTHLHKCFIDPGKHCTCEIENLLPRYVSIDHFYV